MIRRLFPIVAIAAIISLALAACGGGTGRPITPTPTPAPTPTPTPTPTPPGVTLKDPGGPGSEYAFDPSELNFSVGETVTLVLRSETEFHTFTVVDLGIDVPVDAGTTETLTFTFDTPGTYRLICDPHQTLGMVGTITVQ